VNLLAPRVRLGRGVDDLWQLSNQQSAPTAGRGRLSSQPKTDGSKGWEKSNGIRSQSDAKKAVRPVGHRPVEWHL